MVSSNGFSNGIVQETPSTASGTGDLSLSDLTKFRTFADEYSTGGTDVFKYFIRDKSSGAMEFGTGHLVDSTTLSRDTVLWSTNGNNLVNFGSSVKQITQEPSVNSSGEFVFGASEFQGDISDDQGNTVYDYSAQTLGGLIVDTGAIQGSAVTTAKAAFTDQQLSTTDSPTFNDATINGLAYSDSVEGYLQPDGLTIANNGSDADHDIDVTGGIVGVHDFNGNWRLVNAPDETPALQIDATGEGGRLSASSLSASAWYEAAVMYDSTNDTVGYIMYKDADRPTGAGDLPGDFDHFRDMGTPGKTWWVRTDGSQNIYQFKHQSDGHIIWGTSLISDNAPILDQSTVPTSTTSVGVSNFVPPQSCFVQFSRLVVQGDGGGQSARIGISYQDQGTIDSFNFPVVVGSSDNADTTQSPILPHVDNQEIFYKGSGDEAKVIIYGISSIKAVK